jgi:hypothetical protein
MMQDDKAQMKTFRRVCRFLRGGRAVVARAAVAGKVLLDGGDRGAVAIEEAALAAMLQRGLVVRVQSELALAAAGEAWLKRDGVAEDAYQAQHRDVATVEFAGRDEPHGERRAAAVNMNESPLAQLARRKGRDGHAFVTAAERAAGERLRTDYTRGRIVPRTGANWQACVSSGRRGANGVADLTDAALAARQRVDDAIAAVGPELSGVLIDVCCFLKGLETIEAERGWPARSAKIVLKTALGVLSRHYAPPQPAAGRPRSHHWGAEGYRPALFR